MTRPTVEEFQERFSKKLDEIRVEATREGEVLIRSHLQDLAKWFPAYEFQAVCCHSGSYVEFRAWDEALRSREYLGGWECLDDMLEESPTRELRWKDARFKRSRRVKAVGHVVQQVEHMMMGVADELGLDFRIISASEPEAAVEKERA